MKRLLVALILFTALSGTAKASGVVILLKHCAFSTPDTKPFVETYLSVDGSTSVFKKNSSGKLQASVEIGITFSKGQTIVAFKKYILNSPEISDSTPPPFFIDQQRFNLENGDYQLEISWVDKNKPGDTPSLRKENLTVNFPVQNMSFSEIELIESYKSTVTPGVLTKNGYDLVPYLAFAYPQNMDKLSFYAEVYHADLNIPADEQYVVMYYIENYADATKLIEFGGHQKLSPQPASVILSEIAIAKLPSGDYNLVLEVHDKSNKILCYRKAYFQRINPIKADPLANQNGIYNLDNTFVSKFHSIDSLAEYIRSTRPICSDMEYTIGENDIKTRDLKTLQKRLLIVWSNRNPKNPEAAFEKYNEQVVAVQHSYGTVLMKGYNTDRGRIYLKYGQPSTKTISDKEPSSYPYEIWGYYHLNDDQVNRKFVFYNPDLVTNNYILLHSDARGETYDANWSMKLQKRSIQNTNFDDTTAPDHFGGNANEDFNHPK